MDVETYDYELPTELIAQTPAAPRDAARLLVDVGNEMRPQHRSVAELPELLQPGDLVVINDTRVLPARLHLHRRSGAAVEVLLLEAVGPRRWEALVRPSRRLREGETLVAGHPDAPVELAVLAAGLGEGRWEVAFAGDEPVQALLERWGRVPLPPYITTELADPERYQTVFARHPGSVAAPTAGLHLTPAIFDRLAERGIEVATVELAVGLGTFRPITTARVEDHVMHEERYHIPPATLAALERAEAVVAVGTTVVRTLETWAATGRAAGRSDLFIRRPYPFAVVDRLLTNFHVPRSTLLVMIDALVGDRWRVLYDTAVQERYRFLSFGDAMLLTRDDGRRGALVTGQGS
ncbi:MAG: tRNA preQ1(34) S-adenosylmethionine ribosyltransferase-isomerase QueA [Acidimicrobiales bacterium]